MTEKNKRDLQATEIFGSLHDFKEVKVRDHCHVTEKCRVSAHKKCNINSS